jgi:hypothetical protein
MTLTLCVSVCTLSDQALDGLTYHPEARVRLIAHQEQARRVR